MQANHCFSYRNMRMVCNVSRILLKIKLDEHSTKLLSRQKQKTLPTFDYFRFLIWYCFNVKCTWVFLLGFPRWWLSLFWTLSYNKICCSLNADEGVNKFAETETAEFKMPSEIHAHDIWHSASVVALYFITCTFLQLSSSEKTRIFYANSWSRILFYRLKYKMPFKWQAH